MAYMIDGSVAERDKQPCSHDCEDLVECPCGNCWYCDMQGAFVDDTGICGENAL